MSIIKLLEDHENKLLKEIARLTDLSAKSEKEKFEALATNRTLRLDNNTKHLAVISFLVSLEVVTAPNIIFDSRDFSADLRHLIEHTALERSCGKKSWDDYSQTRTLPYIPTESWCHRWLDQEAGFPNTKSSLRQMTREEMTIYCQERQQWIEALLLELRRMM